MAKRKGLPGKVKTVRGTVKKDKTFTVPEIKARQKLHESNESAILAVKKVQFTSDKTGADAVKRVRAFHDSFTSKEEKKLIKMSQGKAKKLISRKKKIAR